MFKIVSENLISVSCCHSISGFLDRQASLHLCLDMVTCWHKGQIQLYFPQSLQRSLKLFRIGKLRLSLLSTPPVHLTIPSAVYPVGKLPVFWQISPGLKTKNAGNWLLGERRKAACSLWTPLEINLCKCEFSYIADSDQDVRASSHRLSMSSQAVSPDIEKYVLVSFLVAWCTWAKAACFVKTLGYFWFSLDFSQ